MTETAREITIEQSLAALEAAGIRVWRPSRAGEPARLYDPNPRNRGFLVLEEGYEEGGVGYCRPQPGGGRVSGAFAARVREVIDRLLEEAREVAEVAEGAEGAEGDEEGEEGETKTIRIRLRDNETPIGERLVALVQGLGVGVADVVEHDETGPYMDLVGVSEDDVDLATRWDGAVTEWEVVS